MKKLTLNEQYLQDVLPAKWWEKIAAKTAAAHQQLVQKTGEGREFLGWLDLPVNYDRQELRRIELAAKRVQNNSQVLIVIGIGGSYLGARAALELLKSPNYNQLPKDTPEIYFLGNNLSAQALIEIETIIGERDFSINVISKSGTTLEPAVAFRLLRQKLIDKYGMQGAKERILATTDAKTGALKTLSDQEGYETFVVPDDIGGRYSVLTAVGLLPLAVAGIQVTEMLAGAAEARSDMQVFGEQNLACRYSAIRYLLGEAGKNVEVLAYFEPKLKMMSEWWKQLFGESEGKQHQGVLPVSVELTTDLHSLGQYLQDGQRKLWETVIWIDQPQVNLSLVADEKNLDGLNYLTGKDLNFINQQAYLGTIAAHREGGLPNLSLHLPEVNEWQLGYLFYFFEFSCAISAYLLGVNPFDQNGVEAYKKNMFKLLGK